MALVLIVFIALVCLFFIHTPVISKRNIALEDEALSTKNTTVIAIYHNGKLLTMDGHEDELIAILSGYKRRFGGVGIGSYTIGGTLEISIVQNSNPLHILMGEKGICYSDTESVWYYILEHETLRKEIEALYGLS